MENIWGFFLQTVSVSLTACLILFLKWIFADKLSPRWQYGVWCILALRILLPINIHRYILPSLLIRIEAWKAGVEQGIQSLYTKAYAPIAPGHIFPVINGFPGSITDWLFIFYITGVILSLNHDNTGFPAAKYHIIYCNTVCSYYCRCLDLYSLVLLAQIFVEREFTGGRKLKKPRNNQKKCFGVFLFA